MNLINARNAGMDINQNMENVNVSETLHITLCLNVDYYQITLKYDNALLSLSSLHIRCAMF